MFKTRTFARWCRKAQVSNQALRKAILEMAAGLIDADLGSVYKKRLPLLGRGKSGGARILVATKHADRWYTVSARTSRPASMIENSQRCRNWPARCSR